MKHVVLKAVVLAVLALAAAGGPAQALGMQQFGNAPLSEANYWDWPGIVLVVNHTTRVYTTWVNGNEHFYYRGDAAALNDVLKKFAEVKADVREVVLRPAPGLTRSFDRTQEIAYAWNLHLIGGISRHLTTREQGSLVWSPHPVLSIYVGGDISLEKLEIPKGLRVSGLEELKKRTREGFKSQDKTVRGWGAGVLAELDPYDAESRDAIAGLLKDQDNWVRLNAVTTLPLFGKKAQAVLPMLRAALDTADGSLKEAIPKSIEAIEQAEDRVAAEKAHRETLERIKVFLAKREPPQE